MPSPSGISYDVRIWNIHTYKGKRGTTHTVKWGVAGKRLQRTFVTRKLAESFRAELMAAVREGTPFRTGTGLPDSMREPQSAQTWLDHAMAYTAMKWPSVSARHRKGIAEALTDVTLAITPFESSRPADHDLRKVLYGWAFNLAARKSPVPEELEPTYTWLQRHSPALADLADARVTRSALERLALRQDGTRAAPATLARKRATLHSVLEYAVELELLTVNPLKRIRWQTPKGTDVVDRRVVVNPQQARALLEAVWDRDPAVAAFFACMYYAGLRPGEVRSLRVEDCTLPEHGWGRLHLVSSHQTSGSAWTDTATSGEERGLKHRSRQDTRLVPAHPELVTALRRHLASFQPGVDGRLFVTRTARAGIPIAPPFVNPVAMGTIYRAWQRARTAVLSERQVASMLARRPYDLRHACLSTWLNAGVPPAQVAEWAGHSVDVLLRVYAKCVEGDDEIALRRIEEALGGGENGRRSHEHGNSDGR